MPGEHAQSQRRAGGAGGATPGARTHVGQSNYYSFLLGYARPTAVSAMAMSTDGELFIADSLENRIKKVPVNRVYDAYRRVGQPYAQSPLFQFGPGMDMAVSVTNATRRIPDGALIEVDGSTGTVTVIDLGEQ